MGTKCRFYCDIMAQHPAVTGSSILMVVKLPNNETIKFVVDCGLFQEEEYWKYNYETLCNPEELEFCLVTHNHVDHTGRLPFLVKNGYRKPIYMTEATRELLPLALEDCVKILRDTSKRKNEKSLYNETDVANCLGLIKGVKFEETAYVHKNVKVTFFKNGHLTGAALILVQISYPEYEDINLLFTGDYNNKNLFFDVPDLPEWVLELPLIIIQESTYGYMDSTEIFANFQKNIINVLNNKKTAIVPVFSLGRAQEILYVLKTMQDEGKIDSNIAIYLDGKLAIKYTSLYRKVELGLKETMRDFIPKNFIYVFNETRRAVIEGNKPKVILTTSGMGSYGPAQQYIPQFLKKENCLIQFTGYVAEGTFGRQLKEALEDENVTIGGLIVKKKAYVDFTTEFSAHAKADEMIEFLKKFKNLKLILLNHGEPETKIKFAERIMEEIDPKEIGILGRDYLFRVDHYGLIKTLGTKFL